jgi:hypothetical protein
VPARTVDASDCTSGAVYIDGVLLLRSRRKLSRRLLEDDGWELKVTDNSEVIRWYATKERCEHFRVLLNAVK